MTPRVSIIVPCFNQGNFLKEAVESINCCKQQLLEVIIINDGSTDEYTNDYIETLKGKYQVIVQENKGLSAARNKGISVSNGEFILLLDSDNMIRPSYIDESIKIFDNYPNVAVVYGNAEFFGEKQGIWEVGAFNMQRLMMTNYIDACAVIRKSVFDKVNLFDVNMRYGWEDWDLWLRIAFAGYDFYYIPQIVFDYRTNSNSMSRTLYKNHERPNSIENYIYRKYSDRLGPDWIVIHYIKRFRKKPFLFLIKLVIRAYFPKYYNKLLAKNKIRNGI